MANTKDALAGKEYIKDETCIQPSILNKNPSSRKKISTVHFPENIVSIKVYDISDDDSDADTIILSDNEETSTGEQQVPLTRKRDQRVPQARNLRRSKRKRKFASKKGSKKGKV